jgi:hypothetical protein
LGIPSGPVQATTDFLGAEPSPKRPPFNRSLFISMPRVLRFRNEDTEAVGSDPGDGWGFGGEIPRGGGTIPTSCLQDVWGCPGQHTRVRVRTCGTPRELSRVVIWLTFARGF